MPDDLIVSGTFPLGQFNAARQGRAGGVGEWPPNPSRVAAALLAGAHATEDDAIREAVSRLFTALVTPGDKDTPPQVLWPVVIAQKEACGRNRTYRRWVPSPKVADTQKAEAALSALEVARAAVRDAQTSHAAATSNLANVEAEQEPVLAAATNRTQRTLATQPIRAAEQAVKDAATAVKTATAQAGRKEPAVEKQVAELSDSLTRGLKEAEPGVWVGESRFVVVFPGRGDLAEQVECAARQVSYLGRPTSPVVLEVSRGDGQGLALREGESKWIPDPTGSVRLGVPTPDYLQALGVRHTEQRAAARKGKTSTPRPISQAERTFERYARIDGRSHNIHAASSDDHALLRDDFTWFKIEQDALGNPGAHDSDTMATLAQLHARLGDAGMVPVYSERVLQGVLVASKRPEPSQEDPQPRHPPVDLVVSSGIRQAVDAGRKWTYEANRALLAVTSTATAWTTIAPVPTGGVQHLLEALDSDEYPIRREDTVLHADPIGVRVGDAAWEADGRADFASGRSDVAHLTVIFETPVTGPLCIAGALMWPARTIKTEAEDKQPC